MSHPSRAASKSLRSRRSPATNSTSRLSRFRVSLRGRTRARTSPPRFRSARTTLAPTKPVPPVTSVFIGAYPGLLRALHGQALSPTREGFGRGADARVPCHPPAVRCAAAPVVIDRSSATLVLSPHGHPHGESFDMPAAACPSRYRQWPVRPPMGGRLRPPPRRSQRFPISTAHAPLLFLKSVLEAGSATI